MGAGAFGADTPVAGFGAGACGAGALGACASGAGASALGAAGCALSSGFAVGAGVSVGVADFGAGGGTRRVRRCGGPSFRPGRFGLRGLGLGGVRLCRLRFRRGGGNQFRLGQRLQRGLVGLDDADGPRGTRGGFAPPLGLAEEDRRVERPLGGLRHEADRIEPVFDGKALRLVQRFDRDGGDLQTPVGHDIVVFQL